MADANSELTEHNRRVYRWARAFDRKYHDAALVIGWAADKDTHQTLRIKWPTLVGLSREHAREGRMGKPVAERTLQRHVAEMETLGIVKVGRGKQGFADKRRGMQAANVYHIDFTKIIVAGSAVDGHDFTAPLDDYAPRVGEQETVIGEQVGTVSSRSSSSSKEKEKEDSSSSGQSRETGRGRVPFSYPAFRPSAAAGRNPSADARLTGSAAHDLIHAQFPDSVEQEMASEFVKLFRDCDYRQVVRAAGFFFGENSWALSRVQNPRAYARKCAGSVRETLDGWQQQEDRYRRARESRAAEARRQAEHDRQQAEYDRRAAEEHAARGEVRITPLTADDYFDGPGWLPRDQAAQVPGPSGELVWRPRKRRPDEIDWAAIRAGIDLGEDDLPRTDTDFRTPGIGELLDDAAAEYQEGAGDAESPGASR